MRLEADGTKLVVVCADETRVHVPGVALFPRQVAPPNYEGNRGFWTEVALIGDGTDLLLRVVFVIDHEGGTDRDRAEFLRSTDGGKTWLPESEVKPELARSEQHLAFLSL